jgi:putative transposase
MQFGPVRIHLGEALHELARKKGVVIEKGHLMPDHVHMCLSIPPRLSVSNFVGFIKGRSALSIARRFKEKQRNFNGEAFWARGYYVSTIGLDENMIRDQEKNDIYRDQLNFGV